MQFRILRGLAGLSIGSLHQNPTLPHRSTSKVRVAGSEFNLQEIPWIRGNAGTRRESWPFDDDGRLVGCRFLFPETSNPATDGTNQVGSKYWISGFGGLKNGANIYNCASFCLKRSELENPTGFLLVKFCGGVPIIIIFPSKFQGRTKKHLSNKKKMANCDKSHPKTKLAIFKSIQRFFC